MILRYAASTGSAATQDERLFRNTATRLAGLSGALLGWRPGEFWAATPAELSTIFQIFAAQHEPEAVAGPGELARLMEMFPDG